MALQQYLKLLGIENDFQLECCRDWLPECATASDLCVLLEIAERDAGVHAKDNDTFKSLRLEAACLLLRA